MHALLLLLVLATGTLAGERPPVPMDRIAWETENLLPPRNPERVRLRLYTIARNGVTQSSRLVMYGDVWQRRLEVPLYEVQGEELKAASLCDLNDDGIQEVLLQFAPPLQQSLTRLVVFSYGRRARRYVKIFEQGPAPRLRARWVVLSERRNALGERGLAVDELKEDGYTPARTTVYRFQGERLHPVLR